MRRNHINYYIIETCILGLGFFVVYSFESVNAQMIGLVGVVILYMVMGLVHHYLDHDMHIKIMLEYIIISTLIISLFIFLKSGII